MKSSILVLLMRRILALYVGKQKALWDTPSPMLKLPPKVNPTSLSLCIDDEKFFPTAEIKDTLL